MNKYRYSSVEIFSMLSKAERLEAIGMLIKSFDDFGEFEVFVSFVDFYLSKTNEGTADNITSEDIFQGMTDIKLDLTNISNEEDTKLDLTTDEKLKDHESESMSKSCPLCSRPRIEHKNRSLTELERGSHKGNLYKCCQCSASKLSAKQFFLHAENHVSKKFSCSTCQRGYSYLHLLNDHAWREHGEGRSVRYNCSWEGCEYSAKQKRSLKSHVRERHHGLKRSRQRKDAFNNKISCPTCDKTLDKLYYHSEHKKICAGNVIYQCQICDKQGFMNSTTLQNHIRSRHSQDRPFKCEHCPAMYASAPSLSNHRLKKHGINSRGKVVSKITFPCGHCGKILSSKAHLQCHIKVIHEEKREFKCNFCDKTFTSKYNVQMHEGAFHTGVLPYKCDFCHKMFARKGQLATHKENQHPVEGVEVKDTILPEISRSSCI